MVRRITERSEPSLRAHCYATAWSICHSLDFLLLSSFNLQDQKLIFFMETGVNFCLNLFIFHPILFTKHLQFDRTTFKVWFCWPQMLALLQICHKTKHSKVHMIIAFVRAVRLSVTCSLTQSTDYITWCNRK